MSRRDETNLLWASLLLSAGTGLGAVLWTVLRSGPQQHHLQNLEPPLDGYAPIAWAGGATRANVDALRFMLASENPHHSQLVWALQALAANNWTRLLARRHQRVVTIANMLQSGVNKRTHRRLFDLEWGPQADRRTGIVRWAATSAGRQPMRVPWHFTEFAERILNNRLDLPSLRGHRGEKMPPEADWSRMTSFLQYEAFGETVRAQVGDDAETDPDKVVATWGNPRLIASVEGVRFYGR